MHAFDQRVKQTAGAALRAASLDVLQVNVGLRCNLACQHCHLECSPKRPEVMSWAIMETVIAVAHRIEPRIVDITGGAPELHPRLCDFISALRAANLNVQVRTNLSVLLEPEQRGMAKLFRDQQVRLVGSLPCYLEENVTAQRGGGVHAAGIAAIRELNSLGYGSADDLVLDLVHNPGGPSLPGQTEALERAYKRELSERHGVRFNRLLTIANMPIGRFGARLERERRLSEYYRLLEDSFNPDTLQGLMCRHQVSVAWDGTIYDCDFNLGLSLPVSDARSRHVRHFDGGALARRRIVTAPHCFGCTAGRGSSCGGALA